MNALATWLRWAFPPEGECEPRRAACDWYVMRGEWPSGPYSASEVRRMVRSRRVLPGALVTRGGEWEPLSQVPELVPHSSLPEFASGVNFAPRQTPGQTREPGE